MVAEGWNLIADTLKGVAEPATIYDKATGNGGAFGLIADKFEVHINKDFGLNKNYSILSKIIQRNFE